MSPTEAIRIADELTAERENKMSFKEGRAEDRIKSAHLYHQLTLDLLEKMTSCMSSIRFTTNLAAQDRKKESVKIEKADKHNAALALKTQKIVACIALAILCYSCAPQIMAGLRSLLSILKCGVSWIRA